MPFQLLFCLRGGTITHTHIHTRRMRSRVGIVDRAKKRAAAPFSVRVTAGSRLPTPRCLASCSSRRGADWEQRRVREP